MKLVDVHLGGPTKYEDHPAIPKRFVRDFQMWVWEDGEVDGELRRSGPTVGSDDCVSQTILSHGVWEVPETIVMLSAFEANKDSIFLDIGCQLGWFSMLALTSGVGTMSFDANPNALDLLSASSKLLGVRHLPVLVQGEIDERWDGMRAVNPIIVKIDLEGAENHAINALWDHFQSGQITHCLLEASPCFEDYYGDLLASLFDLGYYGYVLPNQRHPPDEADNVKNWIHRRGYRLDHLFRPSMKDWVNDQWQFNVVLYRPDARWG